MSGEKQQGQKQLIVEGAYIKKGGVNTGSSNNRPPIQPAAQKPPSAAGKK